MKLKVTLELEGPENYFTQLAGKLSNCALRADATRPGGDAAAALTSVVTDQVLNSVSIAKNHTRVVDDSARYLETSVIMRFLPMK